MKRRKFIRNSILLAAAGSFAPQLLTESQSLEIAKIPQGLPQIRHGLLAPNSGQQLLSSCPWLGKLDYQYFLRNGLEAQEEGMQHYSLELDGELLQFAFEKEKIWWSDAHNVAQFQWGEDLNWKQYQIHFAHHSPNQATSKLLVLPIQGWVLLKGQSLQQGQLAYCSSPALPQLNASARTLLIHPG